MPRFSAVSRSRLDSCHGDLQILFNEVIKHYDCTIIEGYRGKAAQEAAYAAGNSKLHYPLGNHNSRPSNAIDVLPWPVNYEDKIRIIHFAGIVLGIAKMLYKSSKITHEIRWGGTWSTDADAPLAGFYDGAHFELVL